MVKSNIPSTDKLDLLLEFDRVLGLKLNEAEEDVIPQEITELANQRNQARNSKNFLRSDELRKEIEKKGYRVEDTNTGFTLKKI